MANESMPMPTGGFVEPVANDRLKNSFGTWFWGSLLVATLLHFIIIAFYPEMTAQDVSIVSEQLEQVEIIQEFEIPPPPEQIARPAVPVLSTDINISEDITIGEVTFDENPVSDLPPRDFLVLARLADGVDPDAARDEKLKVIRALEPFDAEQFTPCRRRILRLISTESKT